MTRTTRTVAWLVGAALALTALGVFVAAPYLVVWQLQDAATRRDAAAISARVDFPALRASLKESVVTTLHQKLDQAPSSDAYAALGKALGGSIAETVANTAVDAFVTPEAVAKMMQGERPDSSAATTAPPEVSMGYEALSTFAVSIRKVGESRSIEAIFTRDGLSWQLSAVRLPP